MSSNKNQNLLPYLAIEERPNSFVPIDLHNLDIFKFYDIDNIVFSLETFDKLIKDYSEDSIRASIKRSNTVDLAVCDFPFVVIYKNHPLPLITKDMNEELNVVPVMEEALYNKNEANKYWNICNKYAKKSFDEAVHKQYCDKLKTALAIHDRYTLSHLYNILPYEYQREIAFYYYNISKEKELEKEKSLYRSKENFSE